MTLPLNLDRNVISDLYITQKNTLKEVAALLNTTTKSLVRYFKLYDIPIRSLSEAMKLSCAKGRRRIDQTGKLNSNWRGGRRRHEKGYVRIYMPDHPQASKDGAVWEHRIVWEQHNGHVLQKDWIIHHINGVRDDNRLENLLALPKKNHSASLNIREVQVRLRKVEGELQALKSQLRMDIRGEL